MNHDQGFDLMLLVSKVATEWYPDTSPTREVWVKKIISSTISHIFTFAQWPRLNMYVFVECSNNQFICFFFSWLVCFSSCFTCQIHDMCDFCFVFVIFLWPLLVLHKLFNLNFRGCFFPWIKFSLFSFFHQQFGWHLQIQSSSDLSSGLHQQLCKSSSLHLRWEVLH